MKEEINLVKVLEIILRMWWVVLIFAVVMAVSALSVSSFLMTPQYTSTAKVYVDGSQRTAGSGISYNDLTTNTRLVSTYIEILCSDSFLKKVAAECDYNISSSDIKSNITMKAANETEVLEIEYADRTPEKARDILQTLLYNAQDEVTGIISGCKVMIVDNADLPTKTSSPNIKQNTFIGLFAGIVIGIAVIFIKELLDTRIKGEDDLKRRYNIAVLGNIPNLDMD